MTNEQSRYNIDRDKNKQPDPQLDQLVDRLIVTADSELGALDKLQAGAGEAWKEEGYNKPDLFLDAEGEPILIAAKASAENNTDGTKSYRFVYDGTIVDVNIPRSLQGFSENARDGSTRQGIYNLNPLDDDDYYEEDGEITPDPVPEELLMLSEKFGDKLSVHYSGYKYATPRRTLECFDAVDDTSAGWRAHDIQTVTAAMDARIGEQLGGV